MINLCQSDPRWGNITLGTCTGTTIASDGCFITSLAMLGYSTPDAVNAKMKAEGGYSNGCLVNSEKASQILGIPYKGKIPAENAAWPTKPCIVEVDYNPKTAKKDQHFCVWLGFKGPNGGWMIKDPIDGRNKEHTEKYDKGIISFRMFEEVKPSPVKDIREDVDALETALKVVWEHLENIKDIIKLK